MQVSQIVGGRYELHTRVGQGRMGAVYRAQEIPTGQVVAVKALHEDILSDASMRERFRREGEALRRLKHPAIVTLLDYVVTETQDYLILEYMPGGTLRDVLMETPQLPLPELLQLARDLSAALAYAHSSRILHRDIKPGNVLMAEDGTPRLTDFSVAQLGDRTRMTETGVIIGTSAYVSPEIYSNHPADERSDIWSLGVMLYEMLTGELPFQGEHVTAMLLAILSKNPPNIMEKRPDTPPALANLIYMMLLKDPTDRIQTMQRVHDEIVALIQGEPSNLPKVIQTDVSSSAAKNILAALTPSLHSRQNLIEDTDSLNEFESATEERYGAPKHKEKSRNFWQWTAIFLSAALLIISGGLVATLLNFTASPASPTPPPFQPDGQIPSSPMGAGGQTSPGGQGQPPNSGQAQPGGGNAPPTSEPLKILIADFAVSQANEQNPADVLQAALQRNFDEDALYRVVFVRHSQVITHAGEAERIALQNEAMMMIWGGMEANRLSLSLQMVVPPSFRSGAVDKTGLYALADISVTLTNVESESIAPYVASMIALFKLNNGDLYEFARFMMFIADFNAPIAALTGEMLATYTHRALQYYPKDTQAALTELDGALALAKDNPLLLTLRAFAHYRTGDLNATRRDMDVVREAAPMYSIPTQADLMLALVAGSNPRPFLDAILGFTRQNPTSLALMLQGAGVYQTDRYLDAGNLFNHSLNLSPDLIYNYMPLLSLALINADIERWYMLVANARENSGSAEDANRLLQIVFGNVAMANINAVSSEAFVNLIQGDWQTAIEVTSQAISVNMAIPVEVYWMQGLAYCNLGDYAAAETAYTQGIENGSPSLDALLLLRAQARRQQGNLPDADADIETARGRTGVHAERWQAMIEAFDTGALTCVTLLQNNASQN